MPRPHCVKSSLLALICASLASVSLAATPGRPAEGTRSTALRAPLGSAQLLAQMLLSEIALARGMLDDAAYGYADLARQSQDARLIRRANEIELARTMLRAEQNPQGAETLLHRQLAAAAPDLRARLLLQLPAVFSRAADKAEAARIIERLAKPYPEVAEAHYAVAIALRNANDAEAAFAAAERAQALRPDWEPGILLLVDSASKDRQAEVGERLRAFSARNPQAIDARATLARWLVQIGQKEAAANEARQLVEANPENNELRFAMLGVAVEAGDFAQAETSLQRLLGDGWGEADRLRLILAQVQEEQGRGAAALLNYAAVEPGPYYATAVGRRARLLADGGQVAEARAVLQGAMQTSTDDRPVLLALEADLLRHLERRREALEVFDRLLAEQPENTGALYDSALVAEQLGRPADFERRLRRLLTINPQHAHALNALGYSLAERNTRLDEARTLIEKAHALEPEDPAILDSLGWLDFRQGRLEAAETQLRRAYATFPDPEVASHLVEVLWAAGKKDEARALHARALEAAPANPLLQRIAKRLGL
ncbi:MAG: tetratricopeptide repeat protein [Candidatus Dactylopiibacterium sp.]|nr:tetratricopeptide repeat protein [Candidatus Dactylopiibacterium sp.]